MTGSRSPTVPNHVKRAMMDVLNKKGQTLDPLGGNVPVKGTRMSTYVDYSGPALSWPWPAKHR